MVTTRRKMETKEKVLCLLYDNRGESISGEEIARMLGISRNSVWKAVNALKEDGYEITSKTNEGYMLSCESEVFNAHSVNKLTGGKYNIRFYDKLPSSNDTAKALAQAGEGEGTVIVVRSQTNGKGRMGRSFISESENGLYFSVILKPTIPLEECALLTVMTAVATQEAIEETSGKDCQIKWVNDIYINDRKICGILTEASLNFENGNMNYAVVGIGINIKEDKDGFNKEIKDIAGAIFDNTPPRDYKSVLLSTILDKLFAYYNSFCVDDFIEKYREKSNIIGKDVRVYRGNKIVEGVAIDIDKRARLVVKDQNGEIHSFSSGEAQVRKRK